MDLKQLYQEMIIDHSKSPRNFGPLESANRSAHGDNPLCGDKVTIHLIVDGDTVSDVHFEGKGCAISTASASILTEVLKGKTREEAAALGKAFQALVTGQGEPDPDMLGKLAAFEGIKTFPMRVKCATLAWHTFTAALNGEDTSNVTTE